MDVWRRYQGTLVPRIAPHISIDLSHDEAERLLNENNVHFIRWSTNFDSATTNNFWYVIKDGDSSLEELSGNTRSKIRRGLKRLDIKKLSKSELIEHGAYQVYKAANESYDGYVNTMIETEFDNQLNACSEEYYDFWGVFLKDKDQLVAYGQNFISDKACEYSVLKFHPNYLKYYLSYTLIFEMNNYYLNDQNYRYVNDGARSIGHDTNIQEFLIDKFKFRKAYSKLEIYYSKKIKLAIRLLYPFRAIILKFSQKHLKKIGVLLKQHEILLSQNKEGK